MALSILGRRPARSQSFQRHRNFIGSLWHAAFLSLGVSLTQPITVISAFVAELTGSTVWVGGLSPVVRHPGY